MDDSTYLATVAQSSAAIVAIVGGFLVSRLVALSSEREGMKRQLNGAKNRLDIFAAEYEAVHARRLTKSIMDMEGRIEDDVIASAVDGMPPDYAALLADNIPRGSSFEEMLPAAKDYWRRVADVVSSVRSSIREGDTNKLQLEDLRERGLGVSEDDTYVYEAVLNKLRESLPRLSRSPYGLLGALSSDAISAIRPSFYREIELRRLDELIKDEQEASARVTVATEERDRLRDDLDNFAQPVGVMPAITILGLFSLLGIIVPLIIMAVQPHQVGLGVRVLVLICFGIGLAATLLYVFWYLRRVQQ